MLKLKTNSNLKLTEVFHEILKRSNIAMKEKLL